MTLIRPFTGLRPVPEYAEQVAAPPYDVVNTQEARQLVRDRPWSFLHISRAEIDLPEGTDPYDEAVYARAAENMEEQIRRGILIRDARPVYYIYRLIMGDNIQTGLVAVASVAEYDNNRIRRHEFTRPVKEDDRVRQIDTLNAQTGPVFLTYRYSQIVDRIVDAATLQTPEYDFNAPGGVRHTLWILEDPVVIERITLEFNTMDCLYIADGHHRSAAASRVAAMRRKSTPGWDPEDSCNYFLAVIFPDNQMQILGYNRVLRDLNGLSSAEFLERIREGFTVQKSDVAVNPGAPGMFGMYLPGQWYRLAVQPDRIPMHDPVGRLDVSLLSRNLIEPILGISDQRRDSRIDFVGGIRGLEELERRVDSGEMAVAFALYPTSLEDLMAVADAGEVMPPKSTWFEPKLADGLISHVLD